MSLIVGIRGRCDHSPEAADCYRLTVSVGGEGRGTLHHLELKRSKLIVWALRWKGKVNIYITYNNYIQNNDNRRCRRKRGMKISIVGEGAEGI